MSHAFAPHPPAPAFDATQLKGLGIKPLASLLAHRRAALIAFMVVLLAGAPLAWIKGRPFYLASATLQVAPNYMKNLKDDRELEFQSNQQYRQFVEHLVRSVARADILKRALDSLPDKTNPVFVAKESPRATIERLQRSLVVMPVPDTYLLQITLESPTRRGLDEVVNAIAAAFISRMREEQMFGRDDRVRNLEARHTELQTLVESKARRRTEIALELGVTTFNRNDGNPFDKQLADTRSALAEARNARMVAQARRAAFALRGETDINTRSIQENILGDPGLNSLKASLNTRRASLLSALSGLTDDHPAFEAARTELEQIEREITHHTEALRAQVKGSLKSRIDMSVDQGRRLETDLESVLAGQENSRLRFAALFNEAANLSDEIDKHSREVDSVRERMNFFATERSALGFVRSVTPALPPEVPLGAGRKKMLMIVLVAALAAATLVPIAIDLANRRIRTVNDAEKTLGMHAVGWLLERESLAAHMVADDQLRRLAASLVREQDRHGTRVFALCGAKPGAGVSDIVIALARTLDALGLPTLAVEANAFCRDARFEGRAAGLTQILRGECGAQDAIAPANATLPDRVHVGAGPGTTHLDGLDRLPPVIAQWAAQYRFVLVDMPPLLTSADAELLLPALGQVMLVVEAGATGHGELARAARLLERVSPRVVGLLVNRIRPLHGGGYLRDLMIEFLTRRKFGDFATQPAWRLALGAHLATWRTPRPVWPKLRRSSS